MLQPSLLGFDCKNLVSDNGLFLLKNGLIWGFLVNSQLAKFPNLLNLAGLV
jgi:hypothetical protein